MRQRNIKNKEEILNKSLSLLKNPKEYQGRWSKYFKNNHEIHLEIGSGKGNFIIQMAKQNPTINFIALEKQASILSVALKDLDKLDNLVFILEDANNVDEIFENEITMLYLNFSDPWPKKRHAKRRLTSLKFLDKYESIFKGQKQIKQKTDNRLLFESSVVNYNAKGYSFEEFSVDLHGSDVHNPVFTEYEEKFKSQTIYYIYVKK